MAALVAVGGHGDTEDVRSAGDEDVDDVLDCGEDPSISCATKAESVAESQRYIGVLETAMTALKEVGAQASDAHLQHDIRKREPKGACFQQSGPKRNARDGTAKGSRKCRGAKSDIHVAR